MQTAILVDAAFFLHRYNKIFPSEQLLLPSAGTKLSDHDVHQIHEAAAKVVKNLCMICLRHLRQGAKPFEKVYDLYRIFVYDCPPLQKKAHNPVDNKAIDFSKTPLAIFRSAFHEELKKQRKIAVRLGYLDEDNAAWQINPEKVKKLLKKEITVDDITAQDVTYYSRQKGVDMRIGLDIASLTLKRQVQQIILISADSDFVPAAKLARREGIDFVLDPLWTNIRSDLNEHIDGLRSVVPKPAPKTKITNLSEEDKSSK